MQKSTKNGPRSYERLICPHNTATSRKHTRTATNRPIHVYMPTKHGSRPASDKLYWKNRQHFNVASTIFNMYYMCIVSAHLVTCVEWHFCVRWPALLLPSSRLHSLTRKPVSFALIRRDVLSLCVHTLSIHCFPTCSPPPVPPRPPLESACFTMLVPLMNC